MRGPRLRVDVTVSFQRGAAKFALAASARPGRKGTPTREKFNDMIGRAVSSAAKLWVAMHVARATSGSRAFRKIDASESLRRRHQARLDQCVRDHAETGW